MLSLFFTFGFTACVGGLWRRRVCPGDGLLGVLGTQSGVSSGLTSFVKFSSGYQHTLGPWLRGRNLKSLNSHDFPSSTWKMHMLTPQLVHSGRHWVHPGESHVPHFSSLSQGVCSLGASWRPLRLLRRLSLCCRLRPLFHPCHPPVFLGGSLFTLSSLSRVSLVRSRSRSSLRSRLSRLPRVPLGRHEFRDWRFVVVRRPPRCLSPVRPSSRRLSARTIVLLGLTSVVRGPGSC